MASSETLENGYKTLIGTPDCHIVSPLSYLHSVSQPLSVSFKTTKKKDPLPLSLVQTLPYLLGDLIFVSTHLLDPL